MSATTTTHRRRRSARTTGRKLVVSLGVVGAAAAVAGMGTFGTFTASTTASETVSSGTVTIGIGAPGSATNRLSLTAANIVPGDTISRAVTLTNTGDQAYSGVVLNTTAATSSVLNTDTTNGLQLSVNACSVPWTEAGTSPAFTYTCTGTTTSVIASRPVIGTTTALTAPSLLPATGTLNAVVTLTLPTAADNTFQGKTSVIGFEFAATQRTATAR